MVFEVPWDFFRGPRGPISAPGHDRIFSTGDFSHLWGALHRHASRFSGLFFGSKRGFKWYVHCNDIHVHYIYADPKFYAKDEHSQNPHESPLIAGS